MEMNRKSKRSLNVISMTDMKPEKCGRCCTGPCYIAGEMHRDELPMRFTIGDNKL